MTVASRYTASNSTDALSLVGSKHEDAAIPAHAGFRISATNRIKAFAIQRGIVLEWQLNHPVMRQIDRLPVAVIKRGCRGGQKVSGLRKLPRTVAAVEILGRIGGMAEMEAPSRVQQRRSRGEVGATTWVCAAIDRAAVITADPDSRLVAGMARPPLITSLRDNRFITMSPPNIHLTG